MGTLGPEGSGEWPDSPQYAVDSIPNTNNRDRLRITLFCHIGSEAWKIQLSRATCREGKHTSQSLILPKSTPSGQSGVVLK